MGRGAGAVLLAFALWAGVAQAQELPTVEVSVEPRQVTMGDPIEVRLFVRHAADTTVSFPQEADAFTPLDLLAISEPETRETDERVSETQVSYTVAAFDVGELTPQPLTISFDGGETVLADAGTVTVQSLVPLDAPVEYRDLKPALDAPTGTPRWVWATLFMAGFTALSVVTMTLAGVATRETPPAAAAAPPDLVDSTVEDAVSELDALSASALFDADQPGAYYARLSRSLRAYLSGRCGVVAESKTPAELEALLDAAGINKLAVRQAVSTLEHCQAVQFAGARPTSERANADLNAAIEVVRLTSEETAV